MINDVLKKMYFTTFMIALFVVGSSIVISNKSFSFGYIIGTIGAFLYIYSLYRDIINLNYREISKKRKILKGFSLRYFFSASLFLLAGYIMEDKVSALFGVFLGLINVKISAYIVGLFYGGDQREKKG
ncbi:ATPase [Thermosipho ferrireducens]|uniref:ATPase n=1 Tax=Thermosipho ferrireducens TaxID=2571116 RepID=A0ABX7S5U4_9BACT|nr:ATPase [Thermosipho ferrireducens]QTA37176.1 ATPase [Thermosipho ferrireducens]